MEKFSVDEKQIGILFLWGLIATIVAIGGVFGFVLRGQEIARLKATIDGLNTKIEVTKSVELARTHQPGATFDFGEYRDLPVQLVVETDGRIILQVVYSDRNPDVDADIRGDYLGYLQKQVEMAVAEKKGIRLRNGMTMRFEGYPVWGPHTSMGPHGGAKRLYFGESATFTGQTIVVRGVPDKPIGYYPYVL